MAVYKYANHDNNVAVREWCNASRGRGTLLSEQLFPHMQHPKSGINKYKCGEQLIDDVMMEKAKVIMDEIEKLESSGKRKQGKKIEGPKLETNKNETYSEIESTKEFKEYADFHGKYFAHNEIFYDQIKFLLPVHARGSNLVDPNFKRLLAKAKEIVLLNQLPPVIDKKTIAQVKKSTFYRTATQIQRTEALSKARKNLVSENIFMPTPQEEFQELVAKVEQDEKLLKLVPIVLMMNFCDEQDFNKAPEIFERFKRPPFSIVKLFNTKAAIEKAEQMVEDGWLEEL